MFFLQAAIAGAAAWWFFIREGENEQIPDVSMSNVLSSSKNDQNDGNLHI